jgi:hypothetical protein
MVLQVVLVEAPPGVLASVAPTQLVKVNMVVMAVPLFQVGAAVMTPQGRLEQVLVVMVELDYTQIYQALEHIMQPAEVVLALHHLMKALVGLVVEVMVAGQLLPVAMLQHMVQVVAVLGVTLRMHQDMVNKVLL